MSEVLYLSVDSVTSDGHQVTLGCHYVTKQSQVTVVDVKTVELQHGVHFFLYLGNINILINFKFISTGS